jgi:hypothetical protein
MHMLEDLRDFFRAMWGDWLARMSGPFSVPAAALALWLSNDAAKIAFALTAFVCVWVTAYRVWKPERQQVRELTGRVTPKLSLSYDSNEPPCHSVSEFRNQAGNKVYDGMCFRMVVTNIGGIRCDGCQAHLTEVHFEGEQPELSPMNLTWEGISGLVRDIWPNVPAHLDVLHIPQSGEIKISTATWPLNQAAFFKRKGSYFLKIVVSSTNVTAIPPIRLKLNHDGNWKTSTLEVLQ